MLNASEFMLIENVIFDIHNAYIHTCGCVKFKKIALAIDAARPFHILFFLLIPSEVLSSGVNISRQPN